MNPLFASARTQLALLHDGSISARDLLERHLVRIAAVNPRLNALITPAGDQAFAAAEAADAARRRGRLLGPLHGLPISVKDWIDVAGLRCAAGDPAFANRVPTRDATVVARLRNAGAVLLGKTNVYADNPLDGRVDNPYRPGFSATGSSSGEAALIAAGGSPLGLGSDSGGSIRQPAHACGIAGLKPTTGRVPLTGHFPFISAMNDPRTTIGPLARFAADLDLLLRVIQGPDGCDPSAVPVPLADRQTVQLRGLRVVAYADHAEAEPDPAVRSAWQQACAALQDAGAVVRSILPPRIDEAYDLTRRYWQRPESASAAEWQCDGAVRLDSEAVERHLFEWDRFRRDLLHFMHDVDLIVTPAAELPAQPAGAPEGRIPYTLPYSLSGYPAAVVRVGSDPLGLPIGVQLVAAPWHDHIAIAAAVALEAALGGFQPPPL